MRMLLISLFVVILPAFAFAETQKRVDGLLYNVAIDYAGSKYKNNATVTGLYNYFGHGQDRSYETGVELTSIDYKTGLKYHQRDYTFVYSKYQPAKKSRAGFHYFFSNTKTDDGVALFYGTSDNVNERRDTQTDLYVSRYNKIGNGMEVFQITRKMGWRSEDRSGRNHYSASRVNLILLSRDAGFGQKNYYSFEQTITFYKENYNVTASGWIGKEAFAVRNDGFVVYNKPEEQKGEYGLSINYILSKQSSLTAGFNKEFFSDVGEWNTATATRYSLMLGHTF